MVWGEQFTALLVDISDSVESAIRIVGVIR